MDKWVGKNAVITEADSEISTQLIRDLSEMGLNVYALVRTHENVGIVQKVAIEMRNVGAKGNVHVHVCDLSDIVQVKRELYWMGVDIHLWVNNVGVWHSSGSGIDIEKDPHNKLRLMVEKEFPGLATATEKACNYMAKNNPNHACHIINVAVVTSRTRKRLLYFENRYYRIQAALNYVNGVLFRQANQCRPACDWIKFTNISPCEIQGCGNTVYPEDVTEAVCKILTGKTKSAELQISRRVNCASKDVLAYRRNHIYTQNKVLFDNLERFNIFLDKNPQGRHFKKYMPGPTEELTIDNFYSTI